MGLERIIFEDGGSNVQPVDVGHPLPVTDAAITGGVGDISDPPLSDPNTDGTLIGVGKGQLETLLEILDSLQSSGSSVVMSTVSDLAAQVTGAGVLLAVIVMKKAGAGGLIEAFDSLTASGTSLTGTIDTAAADIGAPGLLGPGGIPFGTGLSLSLTVAAATVLIIYRPN